MYFNPETRALLRQAFKTHFDAEIKAEELRQKLYSDIYMKFDAHEAFKSLDRDMDGYISCKELKEAFEREGYVLEDVTLILGKKFGISL